MPEHVNCDQSNTQHVTKRDIERMFDTPMGCNWQLWKKKQLTRAMRMRGPFTVETREGPLACPDGWLAIDSQGWPYPIAADEFDAIYERVEDGGEQSSGFVDQATATFRDLAQAMHELAVAIDRRRAEIGEQAEADA
jgi:hypothetical protein